MMHDMHSFENYLFVTKLNRTWTEKRIKVSEKILQIKIVNNEMEESLKSYATDLDL